MAKSHFSFKKRQKELARKLKQEQKRQRKLDKGTIDPEEALDESQEGAALDESQEGAALDESQEDTALDESQDKVENPQT